MPSLTLALKISKLWSASLKLADAASRVLPLLPPAEQASFAQDIEKFRKVINILRK